jgi:hypothetical protein
MSCCVIGQPRTVNINVPAGGGNLSGDGITGWYGNRVNVFATGLQLGQHASPFASSHSYSTTITSGTVYNSFYGIGLLWNPGNRTPGYSYFKASSRDTTHSITAGGGTAFEMV